MLLQRNIEVVTQCLQPFVALADPFRTKLADKLVVSSPTVREGATELVRENPAADPVACLQDRDIPAGVLELMSCRESGEPGSDHNAALSPALCEYAWRQYATYRLQRPRFEENVCGLSRLVLVSSNLVADLHPDLVIFPLGRRVLFAVVVGF